MPIPGGIVAPAYCIGLDGLPKRLSARCLVVERLPRRRGHGEADADSPLRRRSYRPGLSHWPQGQRRQMADEEIQKRLADHDAVGRIIRNRG